MSKKPNNTILWWAGLGFGILLAAWTFLFVCAARHRVAEVPLAPRTNPR